MPPLPSTPISVAQIYKRFMAIVLRWPKDSSKGESRDLRPELEQIVENSFHRPAVSAVKENDASVFDLSAANDNDRIFAPGLNEQVALANLRALKQLQESKHKQQYLLSYQTAFFGLSYEHVRSMNTPESRASMFLDSAGQTSFLKRIKQKFFDSNFNSDKEVKRKKIIT